MDEKHTTDLEFVKWGVRAAISLILIGASVYLAVVGAENRDWFIALASMAAGFWLAKAG